MLITAGDVIKAVQDHLDDPAGRRFKPDYIRPKIDRANESFQVTLERLGAEYQDQEAIFNVAACVSAPLDLTPYFASGQPLQYFMRPKYLDWKLQGQPDTSYMPSAAAAKLNDVAVGNLGCQQYRWTGGVLLLTPSYTAVTLRVGFTGLSQTIYDNASGVTRGIGGILALMAAVKICALNNDMGKLMVELKHELQIDKQNFCNLVVLASQAQNLFPRGTKRGAATQISAGGQRYI